MATHDISLMGAVFPGVPKVILPVDGGGTATFTDVSDTTAAAADVASGKYFYTSDGTKTAGTASGGGGGGLVYETGTYTPVSDIAKPTISFANTHSEMPIFVMMTDATGTYSSTTNSHYAFVFANFYWTGEKIYVSSQEVRYADIRCTYRGSNASSLTAANSNVTNPPTSTSSASTSYYRFWVTESEFFPNSNSTSRYWRSGRTYKWIAVWKPTT